MIEGVHFFPLKIIPDARGDVMHMLRVDDPHFERFGEVYFSWIRSGYIKGWSRHLKMTLHFAVPLGCVRLVMYDGRAESNTYQRVAEYTLSPKNHGLLKIPPKIWYGFQSVGEHSGMIVNCATHPHDPSEKEHQPIEQSDIPYTWQ